METQPVTTTLGVNIPKAAEMIGVSARTIANYVAAGVLESRKIGRRRIVPIRALEEFLRADRTSPKKNDSPQTGAGRARQVESIL